MDAFEYRKWKDYDDTYMARRNARMLIELMIPNERIGIVSLIRHENVLVTFG